jgi:hypothetical protein
MIANALIHPYGNRSDSNPHAVACTFLPDLTTCHSLRLFTETAEDNFNSYQIQQQQDAQREKRMKVLVIGATALPPVDAITMNAANVKNGR